jgi:hypothetical protein
MAKLIDGETVGGGYAHHWFRKLVKHFINNAASVVPLFLVPLLRSFLTQDAGKRRGRDF